MAKKRSPIAFRDGKKFILPRFYYNAQRRFLETNSWLDHAVNITAIMDGYYSELDMNFMMRKLLIESCNRVFSMADYLDVKEDKSVKQITINIPADFLEKLTILSRQFNRSIDDVILGMLTGPMQNIDKSISRVASSIESQLEHAKKQGWDKE